MIFVALLCCSCCELMTVSTTCSGHELHQISFNKKKNQMGGPAVKVYEIVVGFKPGLWVFSHPELGMKGKINNRQIKKRNDGYKTHLNVLAVLCFVPVLQWYALVDIIESTRRPRSWWKPDPQSCCRNINDWVKTPSFNVIFHLHNKKDHNIR